MRPSFTKVVLGLAAAIATFAQSQNESPNACDYNPGDICDQPPAWTWQCCAHGTWAGCLGDAIIKYIACPPGQGCVYLTASYGYTFCDLDNGCDVASTLVCKPFSEGGIGG